MASLNKVHLIGNLTRDVEVRYTPKGSAVADLGLAVNRKWKDDGGDTKEEVTFLDLVAWGKTAELAGQYLGKGSQIYVEGRLQMDTWDDKATGQKRSKVRVVVETLQFLNSKQDGGGERQQRPHGHSGSYQRPAQRPAPQDDDSGPLTPGMDDDDIPF